MNATIKSARAGEAGRGFAVVASEVKNLANQAKQATDKIEQEIGNLNGISGDVVAALTSIKQAIQDVSEYVTSTAAAVRAAERGHQRNVGRHAARRRGSRRHRAGGLSRCNDVSPWVGKAKRAHHSRVAVVGWSGMRASAPLLTLRRQPHIGRTSTTSGTKCFSRFWMPCCSVAVEDGQPAQEPFMLR